MAEKTPRTKREFYDAIIKDFHLNVDDPFTNIFAHCCAWQDRCDALKLELSAAQSQIAAQQAKIDALMLEYCPDEMTPEQIADWEAHQKPAPDIPRTEK